MWCGKAEDAGGLMPAKGGTEVHRLSSVPDPAVVRKKQHGTNSAQKKQRQYPAHFRSVYV